MHAVAGGNQVFLAFYADVELRLDTIYPATYGLSRLLAIVWLARSGRATARGLPPWLLSGLLVVPLAAMLLDWSENAGIAAMLAAWPELSPALVARTSLATATKSIVSMLSESIVLVLFAMLLWRRWR
jgi:hypothetical protein